MIADDSTKTAVVVDPHRDIDQYLQEAQLHGWVIQYVFLTDFVDFLAGHLELRNQTGAEVCLGIRAQTAFPFRAFKDGEVLEFGKVRIQVLETPGDPESISLVVYDLDKSSQLPHCVLTGDTLFIGDVGRPDLMASVGVTAKELAVKLFHSLHHKLLALPDETCVPRRWGRIDVREKLEHRHGFNARNAAVGKLCPATHDRQGVHFTCHH